MVLQDSKNFIFKVFCCKCFILNTKDNLDKFDLKSNEGIFIGYSSRSKAYRIYNKRTLTIEESMHVNFDENRIKIINLENEVNNDQVTNPENNENTPKLEEIDINTSN